MLTAFPWWKPKKKERQWGVEEYLLWRETHLWSWSDLPQDWKYYSMNSYIEPHPLFHVFLSSYFSVFPLSICLQEDDLKLMTSQLPVIHRLSELEEPVRPI